MLPYIKKLEKTMQQLYPLFFKPVYKDYIWGGNNIISYFDRNEPPGLYAESWEVSDRQDGMSEITNGPLAGTTLKDLLEKRKGELLGLDSHHLCFPLLLKLIDAHQNLSIQVHPNDNTAKQFGGEAKTEAWYILEAEKNAELYAGFKKFYPKEIIKNALPTKEILSLMRKIPVHKDEVAFIPGGRLHAIGSGCLILEIQQNSNTTYRVYDWGRLDRALHLKEAERVIAWDDSEDPMIPPTLLENKEEYKQWEVVKCPYFTMERWEITESIDWEKKPSQFEILFFLTGEGKILSSESYPIKKGMTCLLPALSEKIRLEVDSFPLTLLRIFT